MPIIAAIGAIISAVATGIVTFLKAYGEVVRALFLAFSIGVMILISGLLVGFSQQIVSIVSSNTGGNLSGNSFISFVNYLVPLSEICSQLMLLVGLHISSAVFQSTVYVINFAYGVVYRTRTVR